MAKHAPKKQAPKPEPKAAEPIAEDPTPEVAEQADEQVDLVALADYLTEKLGLEPAVYEEGMDADTLTERIQGAATLLDHRDVAVMPEEIANGLVAIGVELPKKPEKTNGFQRKVKPPRGAGKKAKAPKEPKPETDWTDNSHLGNTKLIIKLTVEDNSRNQAAVAALFESVSGNKVAKGTLATQYGIARSAMKCAAGLGLLK